MNQLEVLRLHLEDAARSIEAHHSTLTHGGNFATHHSLMEIVRILRCAEGITYDQAAEPHCPICWE